MWLKKTEGQKWSDYNMNWGTSHTTKAANSKTATLLLGAPIHYFAYPIWLICSGKQVYYRNFLQRDYAIMYQEKTFNFTGRGSRKKFATKLCLVLTFFMSRLMFWQGTFNIHHIYTWHICRLPRQAANEW